MLLGRIVGKTTTSQFKFRVESDVPKFEYIQVYHKDYEYVLCQIVELEHSEKGIIATCIVIGYPDDQGHVRGILKPFEPGSEVLKAEDGLIRKVVKLEDGAFIGKLEGKDIQVNLNLNTLLTTHVSILAKSGAGKSYTVGVLLEEIMERKVPLLVIDPHGEYGQMKRPNSDEDLLARWGIEPKGYENIKEYGDISIDPSLEPLRLPGALSSSEIIHLLPKLSGSQLGILYNAIGHEETIDFDSLLLNLNREENNAKWTLIHNVEYLNRLSIFSAAATPYHDLVRPGAATVVNLKGVPPDVQEIIVYKLLKDLFELRKRGDIPPFFAVVEEAHNYCPERSFGETKCSKILRTLASEGRKFGLGLCVVSQRPARVDKSVLSQCTTQIILKVTNPNDLKAVVASVEGITAETENAIKELSVGTALVTGVVDAPLIVAVRPRRSLHGGHAVDMLESPVGAVREYEEMVSVLKPNFSEKDFALMSDTEEVGTELVPALILDCEKGDSQFSVVVETVEGRIVTDINLFKTKKLPNLKSLSSLQLAILKQAFSKKRVGKGGEELERLGYLVPDGDSWVLSEDYLFSSLGSAAVHQRPTFEQVSFDKKLEGKMGTDSIKDKVSEFASVLAVHECYLLRYRR